MTTRRRKVRSGSQSENDGVEAKVVLSADSAGYLTLSRAVTTKKGSDRKSRTFVFIIGSLVGVIVALFFLRSHVTSDGLEGLADIIPSDLFKDLNILSHTQQEKEGAANYDPFSVGLRLA